MGPEDLIRTCLDEMRDSKGIAAAEETVVATLVTESGRGITQAIVMSGMEASGELTGGVSFDALIETPWERFEEQVAVTWFEWLAAERPASRGADRCHARTGDIGDAAARDYGGRLWLLEFDPNDEIAALPEPVREELIGCSAACREGDIVVKGWSEGTAVLQEALDEADEGVWVTAGFFGRLGPRRGDWAPRCCA